ncbi:MAG: GAF domain-containing protein [Bacteroidales bacterium]|jgi:GAF domain-containing protein|nr:GAF domain-containing protein [Bacteroidales bacterium]
MNTKAQKYERLYNQIKDLVIKTDNKLSKMATICAVLHHKNDLFFWTGFYLLTEQGELEVACYQGPLACIRLKKDTGVCWAGINSKIPVIVDDVHTFAGHIACNPLSKSEIVIPYFEDGKIKGVLDIDSDKLKSFDETDSEWLTKIMELI